jgi:hypothetical protein
MLVTQAIQFQAAKLRREFARNSEQQKILLGAPPTSRIEEGVSMHNGGYVRRIPALCCFLPVHGGGHVRAAD